MADDKQGEQPQDDKAKKGKKELSDSMHVKVHAPYKVYYDDQATSISAENDTGPFDILPNHHNFMTLVNQCDVVVRNGEKEDKIPINRGVMHVKADQVILFLDVWPTDH